MEGGEARPRSVVCATYSSWSFTAVSISALRCPWTFTHSEETASRYLRPLVSKSHEPRAWEMMTGSSPGSGSSQVCICVNGCQTWARSSAVSRSCRSCCAASGISLLMRRQVPRAAARRQGARSQVAQRGEEALDVLLLVRGGKRDAQAARPFRDGGRPDRPHVQSLLAQHRGGAERGFRSADHDREDRRLFRGREAELAQRRGDPCNGAAQFRATGLTLGARQQRERDQRRLRDRGREGGAEDERPGAVDEEVAARSRAHDVGAVDSDKKKKKPHAQVDALFQTKLRDEPRAARAEDAGRVCFVDGEDGAFTLAHLGNLAERRDVAVHGKDAVGSDDDAARAARSPQRL